MPYTPRMPPASFPAHVPARAKGASTISEKPVRPVRLVREFLEMTLGEFQKWDHAVEVAVPWLSETLWFVPGPDQVDMLLGEGVARGRIWTAGELSDLINLPGVTRQDIENIGRLKAGFGAEVLSVTESEVLGHEAADQIDSGRCLSCGQRRFWKSIHGVVVCGICHPPADPALAAEWIEPEEDARG